MATRVTPSTDELKSLVRKAGLRSTSPRIAVLRKLASASTPISHGELVASLTTELLDRATVYRNLSDLTEAGLVERSDLGDHVWRFEFKRLRDGSEKHPHFTCTECGVVACLPEVSLKVKAGPGVPRSLHRKKHRVEIQLRGKCDDCA
jgi:Fur family ferric uptake transcriptional regulator